MLCIRRTLYLVNLMNSINFMSLLIVSTSFLFDREQRSKSGLKNYLVVVVVVVVVVRLVVQYFLN